jgi:hypothetical protein
MHRLPSMRSRCYIPHVEPGSKQYWRSISKTHTISYGHCHGNKDSRPAGKHAHPSRDLIHNSSPPDWNSNAEFFHFTRGRFIVDEMENIRQRELRFDLNRLASVAAESVGATQCISIKKYPDGMFNKAYLMSMENGQEVVARVPNPNAGIPHFTTASEVATMNFVRSV